jgi:hypothetical protein
MPAPRSLATQSAPTTPKIAENFHAPRHVTPMDPTHQPHVAPKGKDLDHQKQGRLPFSLALVIFVSKAFASLRTPLEARAVSR